MAACCRCLPMSGLSPNRSACETASQATSSSFGPCLRGRYPRANQGSCPASPRSRAVSRSWKLSVACRHSSGITASSSHVPAPTRVCNGLRTTPASRAISRSSDVAPRACHATSEGHGRAAPSDRSTVDHVSEELSPVPPHRARHQRGALQNHFRCVLFQKRHPCLSTGSNP